MSTQPPGAPVWVDLMSTDVAKAAAFYGGLFGWKLTDSGEEFGHYNMAVKDGKNIAGVMPKTPEMGPMPDVWSVYLDVADAAAATAAARDAGAQVIVEPMAVGDIGTMGMVTDPGGAAVGLWQNKTHSGIETTNQPGTPGWFEVLSKSYEPSVAFYRNVFGWDTHVMGDSPEFRYTTNGKDREAVCGIMDAASWLPAEVPSHWGVYFVVENTDDAVEQVKRLGGALMSGPDDSPYGRVASVTDDQGAMFRLVQQMPQG